jgi:uroporphyrinogen-III decarboxylase
MAKEWKDMTPAEKRADLCDKWLNPPGAKFDSPKAEKDYKGRVQRILDALNMKKPDRVPICPMQGFFAAYYGGYTPYDVMYDYNKAMEAFSKMILETAPDVHSSIFGAPPGVVYDLLDYKLYSWPGHGVPKNASYQAREGEYMKADEYDALIADPTNFFLTTWLPRVMGKLAGLNSLSAFTNMTEMYGSFTAASFVPFGTPPVQEALKAMMKAGEEALKWIMVVGAYGAKMTGAGFPGFFGGGCKAPFDTIGDTLRGTRGMIIDMFRQPKKLVRACEQFVPIMIKMGASAARQNGNPIVFLPLHKGADGFMNDKQFREFYWPTLKAVFEGLIAEGCIPFPWAEGGYDSRLDIIAKDSPEGIYWGFDKADMVKVKKTIGNRMPIGGAIPISTLSVGTKEDVIAEVKKEIKECGAGGGYIMMTSATMEDTPAANVKAMIDACKQYGVYK